MQSVLEATTRTLLRLNVPSFTQVTPTHTVYWDAEGFLTFEENPE